MKLGTQRQLPITKQSAPAQTAEFYRLWLPQCLQTQCELLGTVCHT